jgi:hypothetical protein
MKAAQVARLRRAFGMTLAQAIIIAALAYGEGVQHD